MGVEREARILIVDDQREVARVLRTALELSGRGYFVSDVPSGEEALLELARPFDVIVTDYRLPGFSGPELLRRVRKTHPEIKAILITGYALDEVEEEIKDLDLYAIFEKPIDATAFVEAVHIAIGGELESAAAQVTETAQEAIPTYNQESLSHNLSAMLADLGALGIAFISRGGRVLLKKGAVDDVPRFGELAVLLASSFTATGEISVYLGDGPSTVVHYYDGSRYDIYALSVGVNFFVAIIFPGGSQKQMGPVLHYGKPGVQKLAEIVGEAEPAAAAASAAVQPAAAPVDAVQPPGTARPAPDEPTAQPAGTPAETKPAPVDDLPVSSPIELDLDDLDLSEDLGDADSFWEQAAVGETRVSDDTLSLDEAIELGLIPEDKEEGE